MAEGGTLIVLPGGDAARADEFVRSARGWEAISAPGLSSEVLSRARHPTIVLWCGRGIPPKECEVLLPWFEKGFDIVLGSRFLRGESIVQPPARFEVFSERMLLWGTAALRRLPVGDCLSGLLAARREALERLAGSPAPAAFEEVVGRALSCRMKIKEAGIMWIPPGDASRGRRRERLSVVLKNAFRRA